MLGRLSRILVADESEASRNATHRALNELGYTLIDYVQDGPTAVRLIAQKSYSLILSDWQTPRVSGADILRHSRYDRRTRCLPFLMVIPQWQRKFIEIVREDGAILYLTRPFTPAILGERMVQVDRDAATLRTANADAKTVAMPSALWHSLRPDFAAS